MDGVTVANMAHPRRPTRTWMAPMHDPARPLEHKSIVVAVAGGIAAYKAVELVRLLTKQGADVHVVMTENARHFIGPLTFQALTGHPVYTDLFDLGQESQIGHIKIADQADLMIIAPTTANVLARMAAGIADEVVTAVALSTRAPILSAPSMNVNMWQNPITQANVARLKQLRQVRFVGPDAGFLACRWVGPGRLAEPEDIVEAAARILCYQDLEGYEFAISAGPTQEFIDPVRFVGNRSSGKMGFALAAAAARRGAHVTLVAGPVGLLEAPGVRRVSVTDARSMDVAMRGAAERAQVVIMTAAVADFRPKEVFDRKQAKDDPALGQSLTLVQNPDILSGLGEIFKARDPRPLLIGFAAETHDVIEHARRKLERKGCDLVVANDVSQADAGFEVDTNRVHLVTEDRVDSLELATKEVVAHRILDRLVLLLNRSAP
jgi:phosphopantothenoylcysteine decarboxylase/phosphopantothenate--cysteine ligase